MSTFKIIGTITDADGSKVDFTAIDTPDYNKVVAMSGMGSVGALTTAPGAIVISNAYNNTEVNTMAAVIVPAPPSSWLIAADTLISTLKVNGIWSTFDMFCCFAAPNATACTYNWVSPALPFLTTNGSISHSNNQYAASNGTTGFYSTSFIVNTGNASNGNAEFGHFCLNEAVDNVTVFSTAGGKSFSSLVSSSASINSMLAGLNTSTNGSWSSQWGSSAGHFVIQQNSTTQLEAFLDGDSLGTSTQTNSADTGAIQIFKSSTGAFTTRQTSFVHYGSALTAAQHLVLSKALYNFLATMGVKPLAGFLGLSTGPTNIAPYKHVSTGNGNNLTIPETTSTTNLSGLLQGRAAAYPYSCIYVNDPNYLNLWRLEVHNGDVTSFDAVDDRIQLHTQANVPAGATCDFSCSIYVEPGSAPGSSFMDISAFHDQTSGVNCGPTMGILPNGNFYTWIFYQGTTTNFTSVACAQGVWHHVRITWTLGTPGMVQTWFDGTQIANFTGNVGNPTGAPFYMLLDCYRNSTTNPFAIWEANWEFDFSGTQPFASRINNPLPVPPLV